MGIIGKITSQGFVGNLVGTASFAEKLSATDKSSSFAANELFQSMSADGSTIKIKVGNVEKSASVTGVTPAAHTHSFSDVTNLPASSSKWDGAAASASSAASLTFNPGTGLVMNLTASFAGKTASAKFDASHTHSDKLDVTAFNSYTSSASSTFAGTAAKATLASSASHASEIQWSGITGKPTSAVADIDAAVTASHSHSNKGVLDGITSAKVTAWDSAESASKAYAKPAVDYVAASASVLNSVKSKVIASSASWDAKETPVTIVKQASAESGYASTYYLAHTADTSSAIGAKINIAKDQFLKDVNFYAKAEDVPAGKQDAPTGFVYPGIRFEFEVAGSKSPIWVSVKDLVDTYTAGKGITITSNKIATNLVAGTNITLVSSSADGAITINNTYSYTHPTYVTHSAAAVKVGNDATGHVVIGSALKTDDIAEGTTNLYYTEARVKAVKVNSASRADSAASADKVANKFTVAGQEFDGSAAKTVSFAAGTNVQITSASGVVTVAAAHSHSDKLDVTAFNSYTSSASSTFAGTAAKATKATCIESGSVGIRIDTINDEIIFYIVD